MDISLNLVSPAVRKRRRLYHLAVGGIGLSVLLGIGNILMHLSVQAELRLAEERLREYQESIQQSEQILATLPQRLSPQEVERFGERIALYNRIIQGANFSFARLLFELERVIPANVTLTEIQPDFSAGGVTLSGMAKTMDDLLRTVERLKERQTFHQVYLRDHAVEKRTNALQFTISLQYRGEAV
jgi:Tfp pilus assembly protein PilN